MSDLKISTEPVRPPAEMTERQAWFDRNDPSEKTREGTVWLSSGNVLVGMTERYGFPWWAGSYRAEYGIPPFYAHGIPVEAIASRLFAWTVTEHPLFDVASEQQFGDGPEDVVRSYAKAEGWKALRASDTRQLLHVVQDGHKPHEFREWLLEGIAQVVGGDELVCSSAGLLDKRRTAWVQAEAGHLEHESGVELRPHILFTTSHNQRIATTCKATTTNSVCDNSHRRALGEPGMVFRTKHTKNSQLDVKGIRKALGLLGWEADAWTIELDLLTQQAVTDREWDKFVAEIAPLVDKDGKPLEGRSLSMVRTKRAQLQSLWTEDDRVTPWKGTGWGVVQAYNTWETHYQTVRNAPHRYARQMDNAITGATGDALALSKLDVVLAGGVTELRKQAVIREKALAKV